MKVLLIDRDGYMLDFALRCKSAGHKVRWFLGKTRANERNQIGDGFGLDKVTEWEPSMKWADLILLPDNSVYMTALEKYFQEDYPIYGPNRAVTEWEMSRDIGMSVLEEAGVELIESHKFRRIAEAKEFLRSNPRRFVSKVNNDNDSKALSYVSKSAKDMMFMLEKWEKQGALKGEFVFQEFVKGIEVAVGGWFGRGGFSKFFLENFEHKKLMNDEVGVNTGEMGTVMKYTDSSALAEKLLRPLEGRLHREDYRGYIDVAVMVAKDGTPCPLEFTCRPGWPLFEIQQALHPDPCEWMLNSLSGRDTFKPLTKVATGVIVAIPPFPHSSAFTIEEKSDFPLYGWDTIPVKNLHLSQVKMGFAPDDDLEQAPIPVTAGDCVCTISGTGPDVESSIESAYRNIDRLELPNSPMYRTDIGARVIEKLPDLQKQGWFDTWEA